MILDFKNLVFRIFVSLFSFYIISGNLFRLISAGFEHNLLITEFILYAFSVLTFFVFPFNISCFLFFFLFVFSSMMFGSFYNGVHLPSLMYGIRLIGMVFSGIVIGNLLFRKYGFSIRDFLKYFESVYLKNLFLGMVIFIFFPSSRSFWLFLSNFGIQFNGDPHIGRFVSTYFDPNYFGAICCIPFLISLHLCKNFSEKKGKWKPFLFFLGALFTWSRSGIATLLFL